MLESNYNVQNWLVSKLYTQIESTSNRQSPDRHYITLSFHSHDCLSCNNNFHRAVHLTGKTRREASHQYLQQVDDIATISDALPYHPILPLSLCPGVFCTPHNLLWRFIAVNYRYKNRKAIPIYRGIRYRACLQILHPLFRNTVCHEFHAAYSYSFSIQGV